MSHIRGYYHLSEAYYGPANLKHANFVDEVWFGLYYIGGGSKGEMSVQWHELGDKITPKFCAFDDAWGCLAQFGDVIQRMGEVNGKDINPKEFCAILDRCGFKDMTPRERARA